MIAQTKPEPVFVDHLGYVATPSKDGKFLFVTIQGRTIAFLRADATKADFNEIIRAHREGYYYGRNETRDSIGGAFRTFMQLIGIDPEDTDTRIERLEQGR